MSIWIPNILCNVLMSKSRYNREMTRKSCDFSLVRPQLTMLLVGWELLTFSGHLTPTDFSLVRPQVTMLLVGWELLTFSGHLTPSDFSLVRPQVTMLLVGWELLTFSGHLTPSDFSLGRPQVTMLLVVWKLLTFPGHLTPGTSYSRDILPPVLVGEHHRFFSYEGYMYLTCATDNTRGKRKRI
jgi:hypothetical protein